jgi:hypothetical protein
LTERHSFQFAGALQNEHVVAHVSILFGRSGELHELVAAFDDVVDASLASPTSSSDVQLAAQVTADVAMEIASKVFMGNTLARVACPLHAVNVSFQ